MAFCLDYSDLGFASQSRIKYDGTEFLMGNIEIKLDIDDLTELAAVSKDLKVCPDLGLVGTITKAIDDLKIKKHKYEIA